MNKDLSTILGISYISVIILTYLFQFVVIIRSKHIEGISSLFLFLGNIASICSVGNAIVFYFDTLQKCMYISHQECFNYVSGLLQFIVSFICIIIFQSIYIYYYLYNSSSRFFIDHTVAIRRCISSKSIDLFVISILMDAVLIIMIISMLSIDDWTGNNNIMTIKFARALGYFSVVAVSLQYLPQIYTIYRLKKNGSLSLITLILLMIGNIFCVGYFIYQGVSDYTTWLSFAVCGFLLLVLVIEILYYRFTVTEHSEQTHQIEKYEVIHPLLQTVEETFSSQENSIIYNNSCNDLPYNTMA